MRKIVGRSLRQAGLEVEELLEASNGSEGLSVAREHPLDLTLSDINMPLMDGLEFVRQLRSIDAVQNIPVVMITTEAGEAHVVEALSSGASGYIRKPFTADQIKERVTPASFAPSRTTHPPWPGKSANQKSWSWPVWPNTWFRGQPFDQPQIPPARPRSGLRSSHRR